MLQTLLDFFKPLVAQGRTRFLIGLAGMGGVIYLERTGGSAISIAAVVVLAVAYIAAKTINDRNGQNKETT